MQHFDDEFVVFFLEIYDYKTIQMKFEEYLDYFDSILKNPERYPVYDDQEYLNYTKLNWTRMSRWIKKFTPREDIQVKINSIDTKQTWILITEPWCGDAAHSVPQIYKLIKDNVNIDFDIQLRDTEPYLIDKYLTNGGKSIPKLVIRDQNNVDIAIWGPRPSKLQTLFSELKDEGKDFSEIKEVMQKWYNEDKGAEIQIELVKLLSL